MKSVLYLELLTFAGRIRGDGAGYKLRMYNDLLKHTAIARTTRHLGTLTPSEPQSAISGAASAAAGAALAGPSAEAGAVGAELAGPLAAPFAAGFLKGGRVVAFGAGRLMVRGTKAVTSFLGRSASAFAFAAAFAFLSSSSSSSCSSRSAGVG